MQPSGYAVVNASGLVINVIMWDGESVWTPPDGCYPVPLGDTGAGIGWTYDGEKFTAPPEPEPSHDELVQQAENEKQSRLVSADSVFLEWQTKLLLNIASEQEKNAVIAWVNYKDAVRSVDTSQAPNITWPEQPPIPDSAQ